MTRVSSDVSPVEPEAQARWLQANLNRGHDLFRGPSQIESHYFFTASDDAPALLAPPPDVLRPSRPSGWAPVAWIVGAVGLAAAVVGWVA